MTEDTVVDEVAVDDVEIKVSHETADEAQELDEMRKAAGQARNIPISLIVKSDVALRDTNTETEDFQLLFNSIRRRGVLNSILVREINDGGVTKYGLVDGLQRFTCAQMAGFTEIPANIVNMDDAELLEAQIITNTNRIQTTPAALSKHLLRILTRNPMMTKEELARRCCQSTAWLDQRLSLNKLKPEIQELVDGGRIHLTNAYALSKLPQDEQVDFVDAAMTEIPKVFVPRMKDRAKEIRDAKNAGRDAGKAEFKPQQYLQKIADVRAAYEGLASGEDVGLVQILQAEGIPVNDVAKKAAMAALAWVLHFDAASQAQQKRDAEERKRKEEERKERLKKEREEKKKEAAAEAKVSIMNFQ